MCNERKTGNRAWRALIGLAAIPAAAWCQTPVVSSVVDSASYAATLGSPGAIVSIFGTNLAAATATTQGFPLPRQLGGTTVTWNGVAAPLFYVSPTQINFQVPSPNDETPGVVVAAGVVVSTAAGNSAPYSPGANAWEVAGIFSMDASGCGQGAVLNAADDGGVSVNSPANSASPGGWISIYGTGLTFLTSQYPPDGAPTPLTPLIESDPIGQVVFDFQDLLQAPSAAWAGLAPGSVGLDQTNVRIPASVREGCAVPIQIAYDDNSRAMSQPVTLAIRQGGGPCVDPPAAGYGQITWQETVSETVSDVSSQPYFSSETDTVTVSLQSSPGMQALAAPVYSEGSLPSSLTLFGPSCPVSGYRSLGAGTVTMQGPGFSPTQVPVAPFQQGQLGGLTAYQAALPNGAAVQAGTYTATASGGAEVAAFQAAIQIGADIQIQNGLVGMDVWAGCTPFTVNWTGGDPNSWVTVSLVQSEPAWAGGFQGVNFAGQTRASNGTLTMPPLSMPGDQCGTGPGAPIVISVEVDPDPSEITSFSASGLSLGGQVTWKYIHTFQAFLVL